MTNAMSIIILIPGKYGGSKDNLYYRAISKFQRKQTIDIECRYLREWLQSPVNIFLHNGMMAHAVPGYLTYDELVTGAHAAANKLREVKL